MGDIGSDTSAELHMMRDAYEALQSRYPGHEMLALATLHEDRGGFDFYAGIPNKTRKEYG